MPDTDNFSIDISQSNFVDNTDADCMFYIYLSSLSFDIIFLHFDRWSCCIREWFNC